MIAARNRHISPFHVMALLGRARQLEAAGRSIVHMEIGEPDFPTAAPIVDAGIAALRDGYTHYTPSAGLPALREAIAAHYAQRHGVDVDADNILITPGASGALQLTLALLVDPGDRVVLTDPGYPCNRNLVHLLGAEPLALPLDASLDYRLDIAELIRHWTERSRCAIVASPANPTGTLMSKDTLRDLLETLRARDAQLIVDEIYQGLCYDEAPDTALTLGDEVFVINSFSKYYGMTGWRVGWLVAPTWARETLQRLAQNLFIAAPTPAQHAALAAFTPACQEVLEQRREAFRQRRDYLLPALSEIGFRIAAPPQGAFYLYADCSALCDDSFAFCETLLEQAGVAITPGIDFGAHRAAQHVRFAYTTSLEQLEEGVRRIAAFVKAA